MSTVLAFPTMLDTRGLSDKHVLDERILPDHVADFLTDCEAGNLSPSTILFYQKRLSPFSDWLHSENVHYPIDVEPRHVRDYLLKLSKRLSPGGVHGHFRTIRVFMNHLLRNEIIDRNPVNLVKAPKVDEEPLEPVPIDDVRKMVDNAVSEGGRIGTRDAAILLLLLDSGLRAGELCALCWEDIDMVDRLVRVRRSKNRKPRSTVFGETTCGAIQRYLRVTDGRRGEAHLFVNRCGEPLRYNTLLQLVRARAVKANVSKPKLHSFRRSFAINSLRNGADLATLTRMMGHGSLPVLMRYLRQETDDLRRVHANTSPVDRSYEAL
jgi:integrase/recombinase XerD